MATDVTNQVLSYVGWLFLPRLVSSFLQSVYYRLITRAGSPRPQAGTPRHTRDYRRIYLFVVVSYLAYTIVEAYTKICAEDDFYKILGVFPNTEDRAIKSRFRRLAAIHHPDKVQNNGDGEETEALFVEMKLAKDTLLDPIKRFAYDRFGRDVVETNKASSMQDLLYAGLMALLPQYGAGLIMMGIMNLAWLSNWGRYWRYYLLLALFTLEICLLTHPTGIFMPFAQLPPWISSLLRLDTFYLLPFQILSLARAISMTLNIFISQLTPPTDSGQQASDSITVTPALQSQLMQLGQLCRLNDVESKKLVQMELAPFKGDKQIVGKLRNEMKDWIAVGSLKKNSDVAEAVEHARERIKNED